MGVFKKILLAILIIAGVVSLTREFHEYGLQVGLILSAIFLLSTAFLWHWASGNLPQIGKFQAVLVMMIFTLLFLGTIDYAMADAMHVDLIEVIRTSIKHSPWFYLVTFIGSGVKVIFWRWLFSGVRENNAASTAAA